MKCEIEITEVFYTWWMSLSENQQERIAAAVGLLEDQGPSLGFPRSSSVRGSKCKQLRELRIQIDGNPYRVLYAFDSRRIAVLLIGGNKGSDDRWLVSENDSKSGKALARTFGETKQTG